MFSDTYVVSDSRYWEAVSINGLRGVDRDGGQSSDPEPRPTLPNARPKLVAVTADRQAWHSIAAAVGGWFEVVSAKTADAAADLVRTRPDVAVVIAHQAVPGDELSKVLQAAQAARPLARRLVLTDFADLRPIVLALHANLVHGIIKHPATAAEIQAAVRPKPAVPAAAPRSRAA